jgi:DNA modification methylase
MENIKNLFWDAYNKLDIEFHTYKDPSYEYLVNFSKIADKPTHRWFYFQEGYSPELVMNILKYFSLIDKDIFIFDPFAGSGTTLLTAKQLGKKSFGFEINPFSAFMIRVKTRNYSNREINELKNFKIPSYKPIKNVYEKYELRIIKNLFDRNKLEKIEILKQKINNIKDEKIRNLLFATVLCILEDVSNYRKGGNGLKRKRINKNLDPFVQFKNKLKQITNDLSQGSLGAEPIIVNDSCLNMRQYNMSNIDISIFSPPYANCFDPFEVYKMELWIGNFISSYAELRYNRKKALTSNLNADMENKIEDVHRTELLERIINYLSTQKLWDKRIPRMLDKYFYEMFLLLKILFESTKKGGFCVIVVGNSSYGNLAIPTDILLAQMGQKAGFKVQEIIEARKNETSSQQYNKLGKFIEYIRESLVVLKK